MTFYNGVILSIQDNRLLSNLLYKVFDICDNVIDNWIEIQ